MMMNAKEELCCRQEIKVDCIAHITAKFIDQHDGVEGCKTPRGMAPPEQP